MIGKLTGILSDKTPPQVIVDCNGVGYEVQVPMSTFYNLPVSGQRAAASAAMRAISASVMPG